MIKIRFFGRLRDLVGAPQITLQKTYDTIENVFKDVKLLDGSTLYDQVSSGNDLKKPYRIFVNGVMISNEGALSRNIIGVAEIVIIPPISAGSGMVDISDKEMVYREAEAVGRIILKKSTIELIKKGLVEKGDVVEGAKIAALYAVKSTSSLLAYCHPIQITHIGFDYKFSDNEVIVSVRVKAYEKTGVEMEALTGVSIALLTIWDMVKRYEKDEYGNYPTTFIKDIHVVYKKKGME